MIVDHEVHILYVLGLKLREAGYEVRAFQDSQAALDWAIANRPDLIITEFQLPHLSGLEICQRLHRYYANNPIPSLILAAHGVWIDGAALNSAGITRCVQKPFSPREVVNLVEDVLLGVAL
ncbi:MAG: response regulator [Sedimentisphaerales bacterium]|nr:response regulator [Sedimentisphaerales bacterium]